MTTNRDADAGRAPQDATVVLDTSVVPDAAEPVEAAASDDAFPLGEYAVLARFYGNSLPAGTGSFGEEAIAKVNVQRVDGQLQMAWTYCAYRGKLAIPLFGPISYAVVKPDSFPQRTFRLQVSGKTFQAYSDALAIGYEDLTAAECPAGSSQSHPDRKWLSGGQCTCPNSSLPPTLPSDCRVTDPDNDGNPGFTVQFTGGTENFSYTRIRDSSPLLNGTIDPDGHHTAQYSANSDTYQLSCAIEPCNRVSAQVCGLEKDPVRFSPLPANSSCDDAVNAVENSGQLGLNMLLPPGC